MYNIEIHILRLHMKIQRPWGTSKYYASILIFLYVVSWGQKETLWRVRLEVVKKIFFPIMPWDTLIYIYCYVYSLPPCYFTQSALPIYQTGCCSVCYTCDLSRVTDFARCRLFAQL